MGVTHQDTQRHRTLNAGRQDESQTCDRPCLHIVFSLHTLQRTEFDVLVSLLITATYKAVFYIYMTLYVRSLPHVRGVRKSTFWSILQSDLEHLPWNSFLHACTCITLCVLTSMCRWFFVVHELCMCPGMQRRITHTEPGTRYTYSIHTLNELAINHFLYSFWACTISSAAAFSGRILCIPRKVAAVREKGWEGPRGEGVETDSQGEQSSCYIYVYTCV